MLTADEILQACRDEGRAGTFSISEQAHDRASAAGQSPGDLRHALARAARCVLYEGRWHVFGPSLDGTEIEILVVADNDSVVVV